MERELEKIHAYFTEIEKTWAVNPELVISRQFFELWEDSHQPKTFAVDKSGIEVSGTAIECDSDGVAHFSWDFNEECSCLYIEYASSTI